jgi:hypothetical protein
MRFLVEITVGATACALWNLLVVAGLRLRGLVPTVRPGKRWGTETEVALLSLGKRGYVFVKGVLMFGWGIFAGISASEYVSQRYFNSSYDRLTLTRTALGLLFFAAFGALFSIYEWNNSAHSRDAPRHV